MKYFTPIKTNFKNNLYMNIIYDLQRKKEYAYRLTK